MCGEKVLAGSLEALKEFVLNPNYSHCIGMIVPRRLGVLIFMAKLEGKHYSPGSSNSGNIVFHLMDWKGCQWVMLTIPKEDTSFAEELAKENGLAITKGSPSVIAKGKVFRFPIQGENVFTLTSIQKEISDRKKYAMLLAEEDRKISEFLEIQETIKKGQIQ